MELRVVCSEKPTMGTETKIEWFDKTWRSGMVQWGQGARNNHY